MKNIGDRLKKIEDKIIPKVQTVIYKFSKKIFNGKELAMLRAREGTKEDGDYILINILQN